MKCALFSVLAVSVMLACESDRPFAPKPPGLSALISDGGHSPGNPHFFFLPPLVKPVTPPPFSGVFNANLAPVVQICALGSNGACSSTSVIRQFTTLTGPFNPLQVFDFVQVVKQLQLYFVVWRPDWVKLNSGVTYRIMALVGSQALGFADIKVVRTEDEFAQVWTAGAFVPLLRGAPALPITFRIEQDALCSGGVDCTEVTVGAAAQDVITTSQRAAIHFDAGSFSQNVELVIKKVMTDGKTTCHTTDLQQFNDCYDIRITPNIPLNAGHFARVEICLALDPTDVDAGKKDPLLVKSEPGVPGVVELTEAGHTLITCPGYPTVGSPIGAQAPRNLWNVARASWHFVQGLFDPEPLHAATAASLVIDEGLGGLTGGFSHFGWVIPKTFSISAGNSQAVPAGTILPINPRVCYATTHPQLAAIVQQTVTFTITGGGGKLILGGGEAVVDIAQMPTDETGCAEVPWRLGAAASASGLNTLMASVPFAAQRTQAFMATSLPIGIGSASLGGTPATLEIGGHEVFGTVSVNNGTGQSILGLQVRGWVLQGSVRQPAGGSHDPFTCAPGVCTTPDRDIMIVASSSPPGLVCGSATAELDLEQPDGTLLDSFTVPITLTQAGGCPPNTP